MGCATEFFVIKCKTENSGRNDFFEKNNCSYSFNGNDFPACCPCFVCGNR